MTLRQTNAAEERLADGLRERWWCIGPSGLFQNKPVRLIRLGEALVGWRDSQGKLSLVEDRCPHRGIQLSIGKVAGDDIACAYHGVQVDGAGVVTAVPGMPDCNLVGRKLAKAYPVVEHFQGVWAWFGEEAPPPLDLPEELLSPDWTGFIVSATWKNNYLYAVDNLVDPLHTRYLHEESYSMGIDEASDFVDVEQRPHGFRITRRNDSSNIEEMDFVDNGTLYARVGISLPPALGPGGILRVIATVVPIDRSNCQINFWRLRRVSGWQAAMYRFMFNMKYDTFAWDVIEQDRVAIEAAPPWPSPENLYQHDAGVVRLRRHLRAEAERELGGGSPKAHTAKAGTLA
jgi:phenylpropionate dioxygenase-like ring-hydroxylating dioxygenase large terminal subunit